eukprot:scaffold112259_cov59-Phaeocystis_antarctica.AAC.2
MAPSSATVASTSSDAGVPSGAGASSTSTRVKRTRRVGVATKPLPVSRSGVSPVIGPVAGSAAVTSAS